MLTYSIGDICDRLSILSLKKERFPSKEIDREYEIFVEAYIDAVADKEYTDQVRELTKYLLTVNDKIWKLEADIRLGKEEVLGLEEVGHRAIQIRDLNKLRVEAKNTINRITNTGFTEKKSTWKE
jgi:hypothetical protein